LRPFGTGDQGDQGNQDKHGLHGPIDVLFVALKKGLVLVPGLLHSFLVFLLGLAADSGQDLLRSLSGPIPGFLHGCFDLPLRPGSDLPGFGSGFLNPRFRGFFRFENLGYDFLHELIRTF